MPMAAFFFQDIQEVQDELHDVQEIVATSYLDPKLRAGLRFTHNGYVNSLLWKITMFWMGKSTICLAIFQPVLLVITRG